MEFEPGEITVGAALAASAHDPVVALVPNAVTGRRFAIAAASV